MRTTKRKIILIIFLFSYIDLISAKDFDKPDPWISFTSDINNPVSVQVNILRTMKNGLEFQVNVPGINIQEIEVNNQNNHILTIPGCGTTHEFGQPMLPEIIKCVAIPSSCKDEHIQINIVSFNCSTLTDCKIAPVPRQIKKISPDGTVYFENEYIQNNAAYSKNSFYPDRLIKVKKTGFIRDQKVLWLAIYPVQTNPVTKEILAYHNMKVNLQFNNDQIFTETGLGPWDHLKEALFLNYDFSADVTGYLSQDNGQVTFHEDLLDPTNRADYLIITTDELITNTLLCSLAHHRAEFNGFDVALVKDSDIYQQFSDTTKYTSIKNFLVYVFNNWQASLFGDNHLGYVLLVGEGETKSKNVLPTHNFFCSEEAGSDFWYSCVNDDNNDGQINFDDKISDLIIGRFSVENHQELNTIAEKTINYEKKLNTNESWRRKISLINGFNPDELQSSLFDDLQKLVETQDYFEISEELKRSEMELDFFRTSFIQAINEGRAIINIQSHGSVEGWGNAGSGKLFDSSDILDLSNGNKLPIVLSFSCSTGRFSDPDMDCLGEIFLNTHDRGAIAFLGASSSVSFTANDVLNRKIIKSLTIQKSISLGVTFYLANILLNTPIFSYNLLGDPAISPTVKAQHNLADLIITPDDISIEWSPFACKPETIAAKVTNLGFSEAVDIVVQFFNGDPQNGGIQIGTDQIIRSLKSLGGHQNAYVVIDDVVEEELFVFVKVDPLDSITEINENNNVTSRILQEPLFLNIAKASGLDHIRGPSIAAFGDYNDDNYLDIFIINKDQTNILYQNNSDGSFINVSDQARIRDSGEIRSTCFIDFDNDGSLDIFLRIKSENIIYLNNMDGTFTTTTILNDDGNPIKDRVIGFFDYDNDGHLDIYCQKDGENPNALYNNNGDGIFADIASIAGLDSTIGGFPLAFTDYDNDGDIDILISKPGEKSSIFYQNKGNGTFSDITNRVGFENTGYIAWAAFGDYNNDGMQDIFMNHNLSVKLYKNNGTGTFTDVTTSAGLDNVDKRLFYGGSFIDYNKDGYLDLCINSQPLRFFKNNGNGTFSEDKSTIESNNSAHIYLWSTSIGDYDNDGDLDLYRTLLFIIGYDPYNPETAPASNILYRNKGNIYNWLTVNTRGTKSNSYGIGARVRVVAGNLSQIRDVTCTCAYPPYINKDLPVEFGLKQHTHIDTVEVRWPSGIVDVLTNVKINTILTVKEGYGDISIPNHYQLSQNYPNPFNGNTTIEYVVRGDPHNIQSSSHVNLTIYNAIGQKVKTVINGTKEAGSHTVTWNGKDQYGMQVASGVYIYQIKAGEFVKSKKMLFLR